MKAEKTQKEGASRAIQTESGKGIYMEDNRKEVIRQAKFIDTIQLKKTPIDVILRQYKTCNIQQYAEDEELMQGKFKSASIGEQESIQRKEKLNNTGLPDNLKAGIETLSGYSMDDVRVHYNSSKPSQLQALAYAQGTDIHIAPGQEKHLPHEVWHVVQQKQGRVQPTMQLQGVNVNDNKTLEHEADVIGANALQLLKIEEKHQLQNRSVYYKKATQLKRERIEEDKELDTINIDLPVQRVVNENVPMNSKIIIDSKTASDYGDTGIIKRPSRVKEKCMAVEFDNEPGVLYRVYFHEMSIVIENPCPSYPELKFIPDHERSKESGEEIFYVVGEKLTNPTFVSKEGFNLYDVINAYKEWHPKMEGEDLERKLEKELDEIAEKYPNEYCHTVAKEMQDAFKKYRHITVVYEIYAGDPHKENPIIIEGSTVRNHYVNVLNDKAYDSTTKSKGVPWTEYMSKLQKQNEKELKYMEAPIEEKRLTFS